ncbi:MAG: DUF438 domain-containing protein [Promethearchaeota archaeon]
MKGKEINDNERKEILKQIIRQLHEGTSVQKIKAKFGKLLASCSPLEIAQIEEELIKEGMPAEEIRALCDIHLATFQDALESTHLDLEAGHPIWILMEEHNLLLKNAIELREVVAKISEMNDYHAAKPHWDALKDKVSKFRNSENHYLREENVLFPFLEKYGITQPPKIMWAEHDEIRALEKQLYSLMENTTTLKFSEFTSHLETLDLAIAEKLASHFQKENNILFPTGLKVISENDWPQIRHEFDEIGYSFFTPVTFEAKPPITKPSEVETIIKGIVNFETGSLSQEALQGIFNIIPVDITFVDKDDKVQFYSESGGRIFVRTKAVIGRTVQACHPQKSIHKVQQILDDFRAGKRKTAEFWINLKDRLIYIRYFAVHSSKNEYIGCLEVSQDVTDIRALKGEKRLLD